MRAPVLIELDQISAEKCAGTGRQSFDLQRVCDHDAVIRSFICEKSIQRRPGGVVSVTDDLSEHIAEAEGCPDNARLTVMIRRHAVIDMCHTARAVGKSHDRLVKGRGRMPE